LPRISAATSPSSPRFPELDGLRGLAALGVAVIHYLTGPSHQLPWLDKIINLSEMSPLSLDIFFILSGFQIGGILLKTRNSPPITKRYIAAASTYRILPLYYLWIPLFCVLYFVARG
jgi:peptidoglycan/LPS O-acetylase OafA/YrhL